jgi:Uma2 family endonuclease
MLGGQAGRGVPVQESPQMVATSPMTIEAFELLGEEAEDYEVLDGMLVERETMGRGHGRLGFDLGFALGLFVKPRELGEIYTSDTSFVIARDPLQILKPDISFVAKERLTPEVDEKGYVLLVPDLVVEVASPNDRPSRVRRKIERYREAGVRLIWLVQPRLRTVTVYAAGEEPRTLGEDDELDGGNVLPGFRLRLAEIFR